MISRRGGFVLRKTVSWWSLCAMIIVPPMAHQANAAEALDVVREVDAIFQNWDKASSPGCVVGVERQGASILIRNYGSADLEHEIPITPLTVFEAGSIAKQFTAASVLLLAEQGKLALTDDIRKYFPELPDYGAPITINQLLSHTSGIRDWGQVEAMAGWPRTSRIYTLADALDVAVRQKGLNNPPGAAFSYTNTGYDILAILVERVSKETLAKFSQTQLFARLGMNHTQWRDDFRRIVKDRAIAYATGNDGGYRQMMPFENTYGHGGLLTTIGDLLRWNDALTTGELGTFITTELQRQGKLSDGSPISYARGLYVGSYRGVHEIAHPGNTAGYRAWLARYPEQQLSIALLCNSADVNAAVLAHKVADLFLHESTPPATVTFTDGQLAEHTGLYVDQKVGLTLQLEAEGSVLLVSGEPAVATVLPNEFRSGSRIFRFAGADRLVISDEDGDRLEYRRAPPWHPVSTELISFAGQYTSDEAGATYQVDVIDEHVVMRPERRADQALSLEPVTSDTFKVEDGFVACLVHFSRDSKGRVTSFEMSNPGANALAFRRKAGNNGNTR